MSYQALVYEKEHLLWSTVERRALADDEVRIKVVAAGLNRADLAQMEGRYPPPLGESDVLGLECSGTVVEVGSAVSRWGVGDNVCALLGSGGLATEVVCSELLLLPVPSGVDHVASAGIPEAFATAWLNLFELAGLEREERVLIYAAASGVGTAAIQLCKVFGHAVVAVVGSEDKAARCIELGAELCVNRHENFAQILLDNDPFDVVLDPVGAANFELNQKLLKLDGRMVVIGLMGGRRGEIDLGLLLIKRQRLIGSTLRGRSIEEKSMLLARMREHLWALIAAEKIVPVIDQVFSMSDIDKAYTGMRECLNTGKVLVQMK